MNKSFGNDNPDLARYVAARYAPEDAVLAEIRARAKQAGLPEIQVAALDALHLEVLARAAGVKRAVEIGTLAGYSGVAIARALPHDGQLETFEIDPAHVAVAEESFRRANVADRVRIHMGPALAKLTTVEAEGPFDLVFIDANKEHYPQYLAWAAQHLRSGGLLIADNVFAFGELARPLDEQSSVEALAIDRFHQALTQGGDFRGTVLPTGEGLSVAVRL